MKIGLVVDGESEYCSMPCLYEQLSSATGAVYLRPVVAKVTPQAPIPVVARSLTKAVQVIRPRVDRVVVLLDREDRTECPGELAAAVRGALGDEGASTTIVIKDRKFENWLVADLESLQAQPGRFNVTTACRGKVAPDRADRIDALVLLKGLCIRESYGKVRDSQRILERADPLRIASNSRSFRRFLRVVRYPEYRDQSRRPA